MLDLGYFYYTVAWKNFVDCMCNPLSELYIFIAKVRVSEWLLKYW